MNRLMNKQYSADKHSVRGGVMKVAVILLALFLFGMACSGCAGGGGGGSSGGTPAGACTGALIVGTWAGTGDTIKFDTSCKVQETACGINMSYPSDTSYQTTNTVTFNVTATNGGVGCLSLGSHTCSIIVGNNNLMIDCGNALFYTR